MKFTLLINNLYSINIVFTEQVQVNKNEQLMDTMDILFYQQWDKQYG